MATHSVQASVAIVHAAAAAAVPRFWADTEVRRVASRRAVVRMRRRYPNCTLLSFSYLRVSGGRVSQMCHFRGTLDTPAKRPSQYLSSMSFRHIAALVAFGLLVAVPAHAQSAEPAAGTIAITVSTQGGTVLLPGAVVLVHGPAGQHVAEQTSDGNGHVTVSGLAPGSYHVSATLDGFDAVDRPVTIVPGAGVALAIDMT